MTRMMTKCCLRMVVGVSMLLVNGQALAQRIQTIEVEQRGMGRSDKAYVLAHIQASEGDDFSAALAAQDVRRLLDTGQFSTADVRVVELKDGDLKVIYTVQPKLRLQGDPRIEGVDAFRESKVRKWLELKDGDRVDDQMAGVAVRKVIQEYRKKRYTDASGSWKFHVVDESRGLVNLTFTFDEGNRSYVNDIRVAGNREISRSTLRTALKRPSPVNPYRWFVKKKYDRYELNEVESNVRRVYMNQGFMDVDVSVAVDDTADDPGETAIVAVEEGQRYRFGTIKIEGVSLFPVEQLESLLLVREGEVASLDAIETSASRLEYFYGDRGYLNAGARPVMLPDTKNLTLDLTFRVREGELVRIRNIVVRGNSRTRDKVIRRELLVYPGEIYNQTRVKRSERRLSNLGFFDSVRVLPEQTSRDAERDLVFDVSEKRTGQFMIGAGFSSVDNLIGFMELSQGNFDLFGWPYFTGGGQKLRLRTQIGSTQTDYELSFTEPWFMNRRLSLGFDVYRRERNYSEYDLKTTGAAIRLAKALPFASRINFQYEIESTEITDITDTNQYFFLDSFDFATDNGTPYSFASEEDGVKSALTVSISQDTRDNPFVPTRGSKLTLRYTVAGGPLGFDYDFYNTGLRTTTYIPLWFGHVLNLRSQFEFIDSFGDTDEVPLAERLFLGGGRTLRGFRYRDVGPKVIRPVEGSDTYYDRPVGGRSLFMANVEYTIPIVQGIRFGFFYDTGNVWADRFKLDLNDLASSTGMGLRLDVPGFPIRIDRAWALEKDDDFTDEDNWVIWIGYDY
jgi:outer membrane protein insertion porin family